MPQVAITIMTLSIHLPRLSAATLPSTTPTTTAMASAMPPMRAETGNREPMIWATVWPALLDGRAQLALQQVEHVVLVLHDHRFIQAVLFLHGRKHRRGRRFFGQERPARNQEHEEEGEHRHDDQRHQCQRNALCDIFRHFANSFKEITFRPARARAAGANCILRAHTAKNSFLPRPQEKKEYKQKMVSKNNV